MSSPSRRLSVSQLSLYNPARQTDEEIIASFVARQAALDRIMADVAAEKPRSRGQHHLIVGQRGMGKSMLLARIAAQLRQDPDLSTVFVPLVFAEEQYAVDRLSKFWLNCLDSLADACERVGDQTAADRIDETVRRAGSQLGPAATQDETAAATALEAFLAEAGALQRRPVLLVDNLQLVFERLSASQQHALREVLMRPGCPLVIGASPSPPPESQDYGAAFYDHFKVHYLGPLNVEEMRQLMLALAEQVGRPEVRDRILGHPHRLDVLRQLTGGNPRTTVTLFFLYVEDFAPNVFGDLENLLDRVTPLYKARFEELSAQQQVVASAVANHWDPVTARELADATGLPPTGISPQLDRLEKTGFIERVGLHGQSAIGFQIAERFFNIWFLMRSASRRQRREVEFLTRFIESFYEVQDRARLARHLQTEHNLSADRYLFAQALACTLDKVEARDLQRHAELDALRQREVEARRRLEEVIDFSQLQPAALAFADLREKLMTLVPADAGVSPEEFVTNVLGDRVGFQTGDRSRLASRDRLSTEEIQKLLASIEASRTIDGANFSEAASDWIAHRLSSGQLAELDDVNDWNAAIRHAPDPTSIRLLVDTVPPAVGRRLANDVVATIRQNLEPKATADEWDWLNWGYDLHVTLGLHEEAENAYHKAIARDERASLPWIALAHLLHYSLARYEEAESAYRQAIVLDEKYAAPWLGLDILFQGQLDRHEEAEAAYRQATAPGDSNAAPWNGLGNLLQDHLGRYDEAEAAYRKAIALDEKYAAPWNGLGNLLQDYLSRYEEAESAYRQAIALDDKSAAPWNGLGNLFQHHLRRYEEAKAAYRQAIALDEGFAPPWHNLGNLLRDHLGRYEEAEAAYRQAIALDEGFAPPWHNLGNLLRDHLGRYEEAEAAYRQAIALDEKYAAPWNGLGNLFCDFLNRFTEAAEAFEKAMELDPEIESAAQNLIFLHRDFLGEGIAAKPRVDQLLARSRETTPDTTELHRALFAAYAENWGLARDALARALMHTEHGFPSATADDWLRASAVLIHLNHGEPLLGFLRERGDDKRLRPWYEALAAIQAGDRGFLQNLAPEIRSTAEAMFDQITKRLDVLPAKTRRRPVSQPQKPVSRRRKRRTG